ncbi:hypothetical protein EPN96_10300 [bacterium]|nr:MAG: hypothetical protein EPN96_10300 [bacterium]
MKGRFFLLAVSLIFLSSTAKAWDLAWRLGGIGAWWDMKAGDNNLFSNTAGFSLGLEGRTDVGDSKLILGGVNYQNLYNRQADDDEHFTAQGVSLNGALGYYFRKGEKLKFWAGPEVTAAFLEGSMTEAGDYFTLRRYGLGGAAGLFLIPAEGWTLGGRVGLDYSVIKGSGKDVGSIKGKGPGSYLLMGFDF